MCAEWVTAPHFLGNVNEFYGQIWYNTFVVKSEKLGVVEVIQTKEKMNKHPYQTCWLIFAVCGATRIIEYYLIRTDKMVVAENFVHKLFGIGILLMVLKMLDLKPKDIGFVKSDISGTGKGLLLGLCCFTISYLLEMGILFLNGKEPV